MKIAFRAVLAVACLLSWAANAAVDFPAIGRHESTLTIYSATDIEAFEPVIHEFQRLHPGIAVHYEDFEGAVLYRRYLHETASGQPRADLLLSSSVDLQVKLVNDGYAATHISDNARELPAWARWRDQAFGFTFEPAVMVFNRDAFAERQLPRSRGELIDMLRRERSYWHGRIGTYDIVRSSVGYLLASQDARQSSEFGSLIESFGDAGAKVEPTTAAVLDRLVSGELAIGYNLLGSYAQARIDAGAPLEIVYPRDYTLAVARTAVLPRNAPNPAAAHAFLDYLLSLHGQEVLASQSRLPAVRQEVASRYSRLGIVENRVGPLRPIALGPGLLVYLDTLKRNRLLNNWQGVIHHESP